MDTDKINQKNKWKFVENDNEDYDINIKKEIFNKFACNSDILITDYQILLNLGTYFEGPTLVGNKIFFSDLSFRPIGVYPKPASVVYKYNIKNKKIKEIRNPSFEVNGTTLDADRNIIMFEGADLGGRKVSRYNRSTKKNEAIAWEFSDPNFGLIGKRFNSPNDGIVDPKGRILFTDPRYIGSESMELPLQSVYSVDPINGNVSRIITDAVKPNGIALSPDATKLYVGRSDNSNYQLLTFYPVGPRQDALLEYPYDVETGIVGPVNTLIDFSKTDPNIWIDGIRVASNGDIYVAVTGYPVTPAGFRVYDKEGNLKARFELPPNYIASNLEIGKGSQAGFVFLTGADFDKFIQGQPSGILFQVDITSISVCH